MSSMVVAVACCRGSKDAGPDELYPDIDGPLLHTALRRAGAVAAFVAWDDPRRDWSSFDRVVIRSTWDSVDRPQAYLAWARMVATATTLINPLAAVEGTLDKSYLLGLADRGVKIPPTQVVPPGATWSAPGEDFVVKPVISGGGRETARYDEHTIAAAGEHVRRLHGRGHTALVQEHVPQVGERGEIKLVFISRSFSHAIRTEPLLQRDTGVLERPWEVPTNPVVAEPTAAELSFAADALETIEAMVGTATTYARVDVVSRSSRDVVLMEIELIDPALSLWANAIAADRLARAITAPE